MRAVLALAVVLILLMLNGCMSTTDMIKHLSESERSWCLSLTTIYGTVRVGGSGAEHAIILCNQEGLKVDGFGTTGPVVAPPAPAAAPAAIIIPAQPRVYVHEAPALQEVDPNVFERARRKP